MEEIRCWMCGCLLYKITAYHHYNDLQYFCNYEHYKMYKEDLETNKEEDL